MLGNELILKYRQPAVDWINNAEPSGISQISLDFVNRESTVYLIEEEAAENLEEMLKVNFRVFFENELRSWYTAEELCPVKFNLFPSQEMVKSGVSQRN